MSRLSNNPWPYHHKTTTTHTPEYGFLYGSLQALLLDTQHDEGLTQNQLAQRLNLAQPNLHRFISGRASPTLNTIHTIATILGYEADLIFTPIHNTNEMDSKIFEK